MCGRFFIDPDDRDYAAIMRRAGRIAEHPDSIGTAKAEEVFPGDTVLTVAAGGVPEAMRWGFTPGDGAKRLVINARSETLASRPMFRGPLASGRCLIPASFYYEWRCSDGSRRKYALSPEGNRLFYMAALWRDEPCGRVCVIITRPASEAVSFVHDRMPLIIPYSSCAAWLDTRTNGAALLGCWEDSPILEEIG